MEQPSIILEAGGGETTYPLLPSPNNAQSQKFSIALLMYSNDFMNLSTKLKEITAL